MQEQVSLKIYTLGQYQVYLGLDELRFKTRKAQGILIFLIQENFEKEGIRIDRSRLAEMFWPGISVRSAQENLRQALYQLKQALPSPGLDNNLISTDRQKVWINSTYAFQWDIPQLFESYNQPDRSAITESDVPSSRGDFLAHFFIPDSPEFSLWMEQKRTWVREKMLARLLPLLAHAQEGKNWEYGLYLSREAITWNPNLELAHRYQAYFLCQLDRKNEAIQTLQKLEARFQTEFQGSLSPETWALVRDPSKAPTQSKTERIKKKKPSFFAYGIGLGLILLALSVWSGFLSSPNRSQNASKPPLISLREGLPRLAVLPLKPLGPSKDQPEYIALGITDDLINSLARFPNCVVIPMTSILKYQNTRKPIPEIAQELGVEYILEGSVRKSDKRLRLNVQLIDTRLDKPIWSNRYEQEITDILQLQAQLGDEIAQNIGLISQTNTQTPLSKVHPLAYDYYLKGRAQFPTDPESVQKSLHFYAKALEIDPEYPEAHLQYAIALCTQASWVGNGVKSIDDNFALIKKHSDFAMQKADLIGDVYTNYGWAYLWMLKPTKAEEYFRKSIQLSPHSEYLYGGLALSLSTSGKYQEALEASQLAIGINPTNAYNYTVHGENLALLKQYDEALEVIQKSFRYSPDFLVAHTRIAWVYLLKGEYPLAVSQLDSLYQASQAKQYYIEGYWAVALAMNGQKKEAISAIQAMIQGDKAKAWGQAYYLALSYYHLGKKAEALHWVELSLKAKEPDANWFMSEPLFGDLRSDPRFQALLRKYLPWKKAI